MELVTDMEPLNPSALSSSLWSRGSSAQVRSRVGGEVPAPALTASARLPLTGLPWGPQPSERQLKQQRCGQPFCIVSQALLPLMVSSLLHPLQTVEPVDQLLRKVDPAKDRELWVREHKTGNIRPVDMEI